MITLRPIVEADLEMLREHRNRPDTRVWLGDAREVSAKDQQDWFNVLTWRAEKKLPLCDEYLIARDDGNDVGLVRMTHCTPTSVCVGADVFHAYRGRGLGHKVFAAACEHDHRLGVRELWLWVFLENHAAMCVYRAAGFVVDPNTPVETYFRGELLNALGRNGSTFGLLHYVKMTRPA